MVDDQIRAAAAEAATHEIVSALRGQHALDLTREQRATIRDVLTECIVVVDEADVDPNAETLRVTGHVVDETDPAELEGNYPRPEPHGGRKHKG